MVEFNKIGIALEKIEQRGFCGACYAYYEVEEILPLVHQLVEELEQQRKDRDAADRAADDFALELQALREENERLLKDLAAAKNALRMAIDADRPGPVVADLQSRLSTAENNWIRAGRRAEYAEARLERAKEVVEAAKLEAKHQGEMSPRLRAAIRRYEEGEK